VVAQSDAVKERKALLPRIPQLTIVVEGASDPASVKVTIDGSEVPSALLGAKRPTDPGSHTVEASIGGQTKRETVALAEGEQKQVRLTLDATAPPPDGPPLLASPAEPGTNSDDTTAQAPTDGGAGGMQRTLGYVSLGIGGAALIVGAITGGVALKTRGDLNEACEEVDGTKLCGPDEHDQVDTYNTMRIVSGATLIAGGVFAAAGLVSLLTAPSDDPQGAAIRPLVWPGGVGVAGSF
jgi:hypothetical protein